MKHMASAVIAAGIVGSLISIPAAGAAASGIPKVRHGMKLSAPNSTTALSVVASPAISAENNSAVAGTPPQFTSGECITYTGAKACFDKATDNFWVLDSLADGHSARNAWGNWLWDGSKWQYYRYGDCTNSLGNGHWGVCDKDLYENSSTNALGGQGSEVDVWACVVECSDQLEMANDA